LVSIASIILIGIGVAALGVYAYYTYNLLIDDSPSGQLARARLGLDKRPGIDLLKDPIVANYKQSPEAGGYRNITKPIIETPGLDNLTRDILKEAEKERAERFFGRSNVATPTF
jgi:hypothetical protein